MRKGKIGKAFPALVTNRYSGKCQSPEDMSLDCKKRFVLRNYLIVLPKYLLRAFLPFFISTIVLYHIRLDFAVWRQFTMRYAPITYEM